MNENDAQIKLAITLTIPKHSTKRLSNTAISKLINEEFDLETTSKDVKRVQGENHATEDLELEGRRIEYYGTVPDMY